jgi:16S rRNA (uracil1498-N3)-methyltransferase
MLKPYNPHYEHNFISMTRTNIPRLYVQVPLTHTSPVTIEGQQAHYLLHVMRIRAGEDVRLFNGVEGEWLARVDAVGKKSLSAVPVTCTRIQETTPDMWLVFAPIKSTHGDFLVQKATELGATHLIPVRTERTVIARINQDKMHAHAVEAAEQSERLDVPTIAEYTSLSALLSMWDTARPLLWGDESGEGKDVSVVLSDKAPPLALLIGCEGGFSEREQTLLRQYAFVYPISLGVRILRADTAALAGLTLIQHYVSMHS